MERHERRFKKIFEEVAKEFMKDFEENQNKENNIKELLNEVRQKSIQLVKTNCKEDLEWFEKNGHVSINEDTFNFKVDATEFGENLDFHLKEFQECADTYKLNKLDVEIEKLNAESNNIVKSNQACTSNCMKNFSRMTDKDLKNCFTKCYDISSKKSKQINDQNLEILTKQVYDINKLL
jgi:rubrerythrin